MKATYRFFATVVTTALFFAMSSLPIAAQSIVNVQYCQFNQGLDNYQGHFWLVETAERRVVYTVEQLDIYPLCQIYDMNKQTGVSTIRRGEYSVIDVSNSNDWTNFPNSTCVQTYFASGQTNDPASGQALITLTQPRELASVLPGEDNQPVQYILSQNFVAEFLTFNPRARGQTNLERHDLYNFSSPVSRVTNILPDSSNFQELQFAPLLTRTSLADYFQEQLRRTTGQPWAVRTQSGISTIPREDSLTLLATDPADSQLEIKLDIQNDTNSVNIQIVHFSEGTRLDQVTLNNILPQNLNEREQESNEDDWTIAVELPPGTSGPQLMYQPTNTTSDGQLLYRWRLNFWNRDVNPGNNYYTSESYHLRSACQTDAFLPAGLPFQEQIDN